MAYGPPDVLQPGEVETPTPNDVQVLIRIHATTAAAGDCGARRLKFPLGLGFAVRLYAGLRQPERAAPLGEELAGEIEPGGRDSKLFKEGDQVMAATDLAGMGAHAEYIFPGDDSTAMDFSAKQQESDVRGGIPQE